MAIPLLFHTYVKPAPAGAFNTTFPPVQNVVDPVAVILAVGKVFTVTTVADDVAEQPLTVTVTVYDPAVVAV
jgi:hypothetical protein